MIFTANRLTGTKHPAFSINHWTDIDKTTHDDNPQQHKNPEKHARKPLTCLQTKADDARAQFIVLSYHLTRKWNGPSLQILW